MLENTCAGEEKAPERPWRTFQYLKGPKREVDFLQGHGVIALTERGRSRLAIRKKFFIMKVVRHWSRWPRKF